MSTPEGPTGGMGSPPIAREEGWLGVQRSVRPEPEGQGKPVWVKAGIRRLENQVLYGVERFIRVRFPAAPVFQNKSHSQLERRVVIIEMQMVLLPQTFLAHSITPTDCPSLRLGS